jgi:peptide/nickel transport system substrate-binding protein
MNAFFRSSFAVSLLGGALLSGCGGQEKFANSNLAVSGSKADKDVASAQGDTELPPSKPGKYGGTLTDATISDPKTFNLWVSADTGSSDATGGLYDALLARNSYTLKYEGQLADLPTISKDNLTWTFNLKPNLKWSDGAPITADDVIFTLDVIYDPKIQTNMHEGLLVDVPDGKGGFKGAPLVYKKLDERTVEFKFPIPYAPARGMLSFPIAPKHALGAAYKSGQFNSTWGVDFAAKNPAALVASGPWTLKSYVPGQRLVYARNPNYWRHDAQNRPLPYLDGLTTLIVADTNTTTLKFLGGETDVLSVPQNDYKTVKAQEQKGDFTVRNLGPTQNTNFIGFNLNMKSQPAQQNPELFKLFNDVRFRQAVSRAIDREKICRNVYQGLARPGYGPETPANKAFYNPKIPTFPFDPAKAKQLLAECGLKPDAQGMLHFPDGKPVGFDVQTNASNKLRVAQGTILQDNLKAVGLDARFAAIDFNVLIAQLDAKPEPGKPAPPYNWQSIVLGFGGGDVDPHGSRNIWMSRANLHQWQPYQTKPERPWEAKLDTLFRTGAQEMDETKRREIYNQYQDVVAEELPFVYTVVPDAISALRNKYGNVKPSPTGGSTWNIWEMYDVKATRDTP